MSTEFDQFDSQQVTQQYQNVTTVEPASAPEPEKKKKRQRKELSGVGKSAVNGLVFGICGALVFSGVMVIGNKTFLKKDVQGNTTAGIESEATAGEESAEKEIGKDEAKAGRSKTIPTTDSADQASISQITKDTMPSIVSITVKGVEEVRGMFGMEQYESEGAGSGIIISETDDNLIIATNNHVVSGANEVSVCFGDSEDAVVAAEVEGTDEKNDLAIVSVAKDDMDKDVLAGCKVIKMGSSDTVSVGDQVIAIGNALGYGQSVTTGIVSALNREVDIENMTAKLIQTDAAINPGNSGGALLNMKGELIGINSAKFASETVEGMGYAIPIDTATPILDKLMTRASKERVSDEEAGFLGVSIQDVSKEVSESYGIPTGAYIGKVEEDGAAAKAGLVKGDVITKFDGVGISGAADLKEQIAYYKKGDTIEVGYMRMQDGEYSECTTKVTLGSYDKALSERQKEREAADQKNADREQGDAQEGYEDQPQLPDRNSDRAKEYGHDSEDGSSQEGGRSYSQDDLEEFFERFFGEGGYEGDIQRGY
ncbi:MAG: trypsin-like peptidase domain-containing protein [Lachnospiraceae bacterium]|nr:trypsin-like peptidase domain-containing protein [Lachnospiraceae bacterium]